VIRLLGPFVLVGVVVWLYALFDAISSDADQVRNLPKLAWVFIILILDVVGAALWFIAGRPRAVARPGGLPYKGNVGRRPLPPPAHGGQRAPDDDPEFLRSLDRDQLRRWEEDLRRREEDLRRRPDDEGDARG